MSVATAITRADIIRQEVAVSLSECLRAVLLCMSRVINTLVTMSVFCFFINKSWHKSEAVIYKHTLYKTHQHLQNPEFTHREETCQTSNKLIFLDEPFL